MKYFLFCLESALLLLILCNCSSEEPPVFGGVYGVITDSKSGEPLRAAEVSLSPGTFSTTTGQDGRFEFSELEAGQYKIEVAAEGYVTNYRQITIIPGQKVSGDLALAPEQVQGKIELDTNFLHFGSEHTTLSFSISNTGNDGTVQWYIGDVEDWLTVSPLSGETAMNKTSAVNVRINRDLVQSERTTKLMVFAGGESFSITVSAKPSVDYTVTVTPEELAFSAGQTIKQLSITNVSYNGMLDWNIPDEYPAWISSVKPRSGSLQKGGSATVSVQIDPARISEPVSTMLFVHAGQKIVPVVVSSEGSSVSPVPYTEISPAAAVDFGLTSVTATVVLKSHYAETAYSAYIDGSAPWLSLNKTGGILADYETFQRSETLTLTADRSKMSGTEGECTLVVEAGFDIYRIRITIRKEASSGSGGGGTDDYSSASIVPCDSRIKPALISCIRTGSSVVFTYTLTNDGLGTVNDFRIYPPNSQSLISGGSRSVVVDDVGTEYAYPQMTFRSKSTNGFYTLGDAFPEGVACKGTIILKDVPASAKKITVLLGIYAYPNSLYYLAGNVIEFKNVPIY